MTAAPARLLHTAGPQFPGLRRPAYDVAGSPQDNARCIAQWLWGDLRAQWCASLVDDLVDGGEVPTDAGAARPWVAGVLCAAAADAGRAVRPGTWARTVTGIADAVGVERDEALARWSDLVTAGRTRPRDLPAHWRRDA